MAATKHTVKIEQIIETEADSSSPGLRVKIGDNEIFIPLESKVYDWVREQFFGGKPGSVKSKKKATMLSVVAAAYRKGIDDGKKSRPNV